ncbi:cation diffusion facilitator family transporter [candidate division KSB1 bacterium]
MVGVFTNIAVAAIKLVLGLMGKSAVLVAEAFDSLSDVGATTAVLIGLKYATEPRDEDHPHGHGKIDSFIALFVALAMGGTGVFLIIQNTLRIYYGNYVHPEWIALAGVVTAIVLKAGLYRYTISAGRKLNSPSIRANAYDHKADVYRLTGVFFGILFAIIGFPIIDPLAALIVSVFIIRMSFFLARDTFEDLIDKQMPVKFRDQIEDVVTSWNPEYRLLEAIGRRMGSRYQVNAKIHVSPYVQAVDSAADLRGLEACIINLIPHIQGVDITTDVDRTEALKFEQHFKERVNTVLEKYHSDYLSVENPEFHFFENQQEFHCDLFVNPNMPVRDADRIRQRIKNDITRDFEDAQVIITIQPATIH